MTPWHPVEQGQGGRKKRVRDVEYREQSWDLTHDLLCKEVWGTPSAQVRMHTFNSLTSRLY